VCNLDIWTRSFSGPAKTWISIPAHRFFLSIHNSCYLTELRINKKNWADRKCTGRGCSRGFVQLIALWRDFLSSWRWPAAVESAAIMRLLAGEAVLHLAMETLLEAAAMSRLPEILIAMWGSKFHIHKVSNLTARTHFSGHYKIHNSVCRARQCL